MSDQTAFFETDDRRPWQRSAHELARRTDPETSKAAARRLEAGSIRKALLKTFLVGSRTFEEAADVAGIDPWQASKRVSDLIAAGFVHDTGGTRSGASGRQQRILQITAEGRKALA